MEPQQWRPRTVLNFVIYRAFWSITFFALAIFLQCFKRAWNDPGLGPGNRLGFLRVIFPRMVIWKVTKPCMVWRGWVGRGGGAAFSFGIAWWPPPPPPPRRLSPLPPPCPHPQHPPPFFLFLTTSQRVEFKEFPCKISLPRNASWSRMSSTVYSKLLTVFFF